MIKPAVQNVSALRVTTKVYCDMSNRELGTVKWFNDEKGFGFIMREAGGNDVFVHHSQISAQGRRSLADGQRVEFTVGLGPKGEQAQDVTAL